MECAAHAINVLALSLRPAAAQVVGEAPCRTTYKYRFPEWPPFFSFHTLTSRYSPFRTAERAQMPETELLSAFSSEKRRVLHVQTRLLFVLLCLRSIVIPGPSSAQLSSVTHRSANPAERRAVPCPAVRYGAVPCCVLFHTYSFVHARSHSTKYHPAVPRYNLGCNWNAHKIFAIQASLIREIRGLCAYIIQQHVRYVQQ